MDCCDKIVQRICDDLSNDINAELCEQIKDHVKECKDCRDQLDSMKGTVELFKCLKEKKVPQDVHNRLLTILNVDSQEQVVEKQ